MSMPQIPEEKYRPNLYEVTIDIFKSVALEETALSHILNAEGERYQAIVRKFECSRNCISIDELNDSIRQTEKILNTIIMKEWLLLKKLETALEINQTMSDKKEEPCRKPCCYHCCAKSDCCRKYHCAEGCYDCLTRM